MDSGRFLLAVVLMIAVMVVTNMLFAPDRPVPGATGADTLLVDTAGAAPVGADADSAPPRARDTAAVPAATPPDTAAVADPDRQPIPGEEIAGDTIFLATPLIRLGFAANGALVSARLEEYEGFGEDAAENDRVELAPRNGRGLVRPRLRVGDRDVDLPLSPVPGDTTDGATAVFEGSDGRRSARLTYRVPDDGYLLRVTLEAAGFEQTPQLLLDLPSTLRVNEANPGEDERSLAYVVNSPRQGIESVRLRSVREPRTDNGPFTWVAVKNKYFLVAAIAAGEGTLPFGGVRANPLEERDAAELVASLPPATDGTFAFDLYIGPQEADRLSAVGYELEDVNPYGWSLFRPILRPLGHAITWAVVGLHNTLNIAYGWVLILFGVLVRIVLWPLNARSMRSQLKNMELQPRIKEIQEKYRNSPEMMQKEMMKLYKEGFNPLGGCLPLLIPFPVLIALFFVFQSTIYFRGVDFLWLPDLSRHDPLYILPVALGASMFLQQWIMAKSTPPHMDNPQMKMMMYFMPVFMTVIFLRFASGLNLYYVAQNIASLPQQYQLMRERRAWQAGKRKIEGAAAR